MTLGMMHAYYTALGFLFLTMVSSCSDPSSKAPRVLYADLAFNMKCPGLEFGDVERTIEAFLPKHGFATLNQGRIQREHGIRLVEMKILGIDDKRRMVNFVAFNQDWYSVTLNTEPPT